MIWWRRSTALALLTVLLVSQAQAHRALVEPTLVRTPASTFQASPWWTLDGLARIVGADLFNYTPKALGPAAYLRVFNTTREVRDGDILFYPHEDYQLRPIDARGWQNVRNRLGSIDPFPALIRLPPGRYVIRTRWSLAVVDAHEGIVTDVILPESR
ncbi:MAG: hypothetical protein SNJ82_08210 [Gemmataceae bacterium]